jgi:hypothetical protein
VDGVGGDEDVANHPCGNEDISQEQPFRQLAGETGKGPLTLCDKEPYGNLQQEYLQRCMEVTTQIVHIFV